MTDDKAALLEVRLTQFVKHRLPRLVAIKKKVDAGERLSTGDVEVMDQIIKEAQDSKATLGFVNTYPEYGDLVAKAVDLYQEITEKALENETQP